MSRLRSRRSRLPSRFSCTNLTLALALALALALTTDPNPNPNPDQAALKALPLVTDQRQADGVAAAVNTLYDLLPNT